ncbi:MAG: flavin reductase family protein [Lishizhenia sp.]
MEEKSFSRQEIEALENRYRAQLINSLSGAKSANLIGTQNKEQQTNLAIISSVVHLGSNPALFGFIQRPTTVERHTFENIVETEYYTINQIHKDIYRAAHQSSARYERNESEFEKVGLSEEYKSDFFAPFVKESHIKLGLKLEEIVDLKINGTKLVIGSVQQLYIPENALAPDGFVNLAATDALAITGLDTYNSLTVLERLSYAKPDLPLTNIEI